MVEEIWGIVDGMVDGKSAMYQVEERTLNEEMMAELEKGIWAYTC